MHIEVALEGFDASDLATLVPIAAGLPRDGGARGRIEVSLTRESVPDASPALPAIFFHGRTRAFLDTRDVVLSDGFSLVRVALDGRTISARVDPRSLADGYSFGHATMFIAVAIALRAHGLFHLHAGGVVSPSGETILIAGEGGSGKTTTTLALIHSGYDYLGDDAVLVARANGGEPEILQLAKPFHLHDRVLASFPALSPHTGDPYRANHDKRALDPRAAFRGRERSSAPAPRRILFPTIADLEHTKLEPMAQAETMGELIRSSALAVVDGLPGAKAQLELFRDLAGGARGFHLELGRDLLADPKILAALL